MNNLSFYLLRPEYGIEKPEMVIQVSAETHKKAVNKINYLADEADIDLDDYREPILTEYPHTNWHTDLPEPETFSTAWLERFELLGDCGRTWFPVNPTSSVTPEPEGDKEPEENPETESVVVSIPTTPLKPREKFMRLSRNARVVAVLERGFYVIDQDLTEQETSEFSRKAINAGDDDKYLADFLYAVQLPELSDFNAPRFAAFIAGVGRRFERGDADATFTDIRKFCLYLLGMDAGKADPDRFNTVVALLVMGKHPVGAKASDVNKAKELVAMREEAWRAWHTSLQLVPGILTLPEALLYELTFEGMKNLKLIRDSAGRRQYIRDHFAGHPLLPDYPIEDIEKHDEAEQIPQSADSALADAALQADAVAQDTAELPDAAQSMETQPPLAERTGPFYVRNEAGEVKRANKQKGLEDLIVQGYAEITKDEYQRLKNASAANGVDFRENADPSTESVRENTNLSTSTAHEENLAASINDVQIVESAPGKFSAEAFLTPESASGNATEDGDTAGPDTSHEGEKAEVAPEARAAEEPEEPREVYVGPGIYHHISNADYHSGPGVSKSQLDDISIDPAIFSWRKAAPVDTDKTAALDKGTALHCLLLEPEEYDSRFIIAPEFNRRTKEGKEEEKAFIEECGGRGQIIISHDDNRKLKLMRESAMAHPGARALLEAEGFCESSLYWNDSDTGELCRIRPDKYLTNMPFIVDVKKVADMSRFSRHIEEFRYHVQAAMYSEGWRVHTGEMPRFAFLAVSESIDCGRYPVHLYILDEADMEEGYRLFRRDLETWHRCNESGEWGWGFETIQRPYWARG